MFARGTQALDLKADVCTWQFEKVSDKEFVITYQSTRLGGNNPGQLKFSIINPLRIHNTVQSYDAFRIVCPAQELEIFEKVLASWQRLADRDVSNLKNQHDLSNVLVTVGEVLSSQGKHQAALEDFVKSLMIRKKLVLSDPLNRGWQGVESRWSRERVEHRRHRYRRHLHRPRRLSGRRDRHSEMLDRAVRSDRGCGAGAAYRRL